MRPKFLFFILAFTWILAACSATGAQPAAPAAAQPAEAAADAPVEPAAAPALPEIRIDAADYAYQAPEKVSAGWTKVTLTNSGAEPHHVQFLRLNDGVTMEQFTEALQQGEGPALALVRHMGGVGAIAPTGSAQAILNLPAGTYVILCFISSPSDHLPHMAKGMLQPLTVAPASGTTAGEPSADLTVTMQDFSFTMPESLGAGETLIKVVNQGPEPHELNLILLADGKTTDDVVKWLAAPDGPPPFTPVGGINGLEMGEQGYIAFDFQPGRYAAICNIPSPKAEGHQHFSLGMIKEFTIK